jgi:hypothetical protein
VNDKTESRIAQNSGERKQLTLSEKEQKLSSQPATFTVKICARTPTEAVKGARLQLTHKRSAFAAVHCMDCLINRVHGMTVVNFNTKKDQQANRDCYCLSE